MLIMCGPSPCCASCRRGVPSSCRRAVVPPSCSAVGVGPSSTRAIVLTVVWSPEKTAIAWDVVELVRSCRRPHVAKPSCHARDVVLSCRRGRRAVMRSYAVVAVVPSCRCHAAVERRAVVSCRCAVDSSCCRAIMLSCWNRTDFLPKQTRPPHLTCCSTTHPG